VGWGHDRTRHEARGDGTPIVVDGQQVGTLVASIESSGQETLEDEFLRSVRRSLLLAGLAAGVIALALGSFLFLQVAKQSQGR
jgi:hypothetical protein